MKALFSGLALSVCLAAPVMAADMPVKAPRPAPVVVAYNWTGCYIGVHGGGGRQRAAASFSFTGADPFADDGRTDGNGALVGGHVGCNFQTGQWVLGIEGDGEWTTFKGQNNSENGDLMELRQRAMGSVRGRLGVAFDRWLVYGTGGFAISGARSSVLDPGEQENISRTITGWTAGGGLEYGFTPNFSGRVEGRYTGFGTEDFRHPINCYTERYSNVNIWTVRAGLTYRFGGPVVARY
jgi:outer membrane immunogenic protein